MLNLQIKVMYGKYAGHTYAGRRICYDYKHTGSSPDLFEIITPEGSDTVLSTEIDMEDYSNQLVQKTENELGATVGDTVKIIDGGSGWFKPGWSVDENHVITKICETGHITFDDGKASMFRPKVMKVKS